MKSPQKSSDLKPLMERISCYLSYSLQGNILSASSHEIYSTYIQQTVLATKSSHIKVRSQVSSIDCLVFKQQKTI